MARIYMHGETITSSLQAEVILTQLWRQDNLCLYSWNQTLYTCCSQEPNGQEEGSDDDLHFSVKYTYQSSGPQFPVNLYWAKTTLRPTVKGRQEDAYAVPVNPLHYNIR